MVRGFKSIRIRLKRPSAHPEVGHPPGRTQGVDRSISARRPTLTGALEALRSRWDAAMIAATFYAPQPAQKLTRSQVLPPWRCPYRKGRLLSCCGMVMLTKLEISSRSSRSARGFSSPASLPWRPSSKRRSEVDAIVSKLRGKQHVGELQAFTRAYRERRDRRSDGRFLSHDAMLRAVAERIAAGRKIKTFDAALVDEIMSEMAWPAGRVPRAPKNRAGHREDAGA